MTERLSGLLTRSGYERYYKSNLWQRKAADGRIVSQIFLGAQANMYPDPDRFVYEGDMKDLPAFLTAFTPDEVLRILNDVEWGFRESGRNTEEITGALDAIALIRKYVQERAAGGSLRGEHGCGCGRASCQC